MVRVGNAATDMPAERVDIINSMTPMGRAGLYYFCRGDAAMTAALVLHVFQHKSAREVASRCQVPAPTITRWARDFRRLTRLLCEDWGVKPAELFADNRRDE